MAGFTCENLKQDTDTGDWVCGVDGNIPDGAQLVNVRLLDINSNGEEVQMPGSKTIKKCTVFNIFNAKIMSRSISDKCGSSSVVSNSGGFKTSLV